MTNSIPSHDLALRLIGFGRLDRAEEVCRTLLAKDEQDIPARQILGMVEQKRGRFVEAIAIFEDALARQPGNVGLLCSIGRAQKIQGRYDDALGRFEEALVFAPEHPPALEGTVEVLERLGRSDEALALLQPIIDSGNESPTSAFLCAELHRKAGRPGDALPLLVKHLDRPRLKPSYCRQLGFAYGRTLEALGNTADAFKAYALANVSDNPFPFDAPAWTGRTDRTLATFSATRIAARPGAPGRGRGLVFIVGAPRSGSTLLDRILLAHPSVHSLGESDQVPRLIARIDGAAPEGVTFPESIDHVDADAVPKWADDVMGAARADAGAATVVVDKHLANVRFLGVIAQFLPEAKVVFTRRDPMAIGFSCFVNPLPPRPSPWSARLFDIGVFLRDLDRLVAHWKTVLPLPHHDAVYEEIVADPEGQIRALLDFCGLPWDDACLRFHEEAAPAATISYDQVRRPIYEDALERHRAFGEDLIPLERALAGETVGWSDAASAPGA